MSKPASRPTSAAKGSSRPSSVRSTRPSSSASRPGSAKPDSRPASSAKAASGSRPPSAAKSASRPASATKSTTGSRPASAAKPASAKSKAAAPPKATSKKNPRTPTPWLEVLAGASEAELWSGKMSKREAREKWKTFLYQDVQSALQQPRTPLAQDVVEVVLNGDLGHLDVSKIPNIRNKVVIFVSSTFTDTKAERNTLMRDVYPYLRTLCRTLGLDFGTVDMRWGVNEESTFEHDTTDMCIREVRRCTRESAGPAFLCLLSHKYGYRPFPNEIEKEDFELLLKTIEESGSDKDTSVLKEWFKYDENSLQPKYILKPRTAEDKDWWTLFEKMQGQLREAATCLPPEKEELYRVSVTEKEVQAGIFNNPEKEKQVVLLDRTLSEITDEKHRHRHILDVKGKDIDEDAQKHMKDLKEVKVIEAVLDQQKIVAQYDETDESSVKRYIRKVCDDVCEQLSRSILDNYLQHLHVERDDVFQEILIHRATALDKCELFVGREDLIEKVVGSVTPDNKRVYALHGNSGCGKTALMAMCAKQVREKNPEAVMVVRFLGTTSNSASARALLSSVCTQITRIYQKDVKKIPEEYKELCVYFKECLSFASADKPLIVILDSLDQLSNEDFGRNLKWLPMKEDLPENCNMVVSTLPNECLDILDGFVPKDNLLEVKSLELSDGPLILEKMLAAAGRTVTEDQKKIILDAFENCPLPLYLRLCVDIAVKWRSYDEVTPEAIAADMPGMITLLFQRLESKFGKTFVHHALAYITAAKNGLSVGELEDVLSCDDETLNEIFTFWLPPFRRIPPLLWLRVRNDLGMYLVERGTDGVNAYGWYHRQFWETAQSRYLDASPDAEEPFEPKAREAIADYFEAKYYEFKEYTVPKGSKFYKNNKPIKENRQIPTQPIVVAGDRETGFIYNRRKLRELSHQLLKLKDWERFEKDVCTLQFIEAKFGASQGYECVAEFIEASRETDNKTIKAMSKFIGANLSHLLAEPDGIYQLASQQVASNVVRQMFDSITVDELPRDMVRDKDPSDIEDPCEMTLRGHTSGVRMCWYSPGGELICSTSEDGSLRLWDAFSGAEVVTVTGLPGPTYPSLADPYHGERPCAFSQNGRIVVTGSEDGVLQFWDLTGVEVHKNTDHTATITGISYSPDGKTLVSCSKDKTVKFWDAESRECKGQTQIDGQGLGCDYAPDGSKVAIATYGGPGLTMIDASSFSIISANSGHTNLNICVAYSPLGDIVATAGDNSSISLWDAASGTTRSLLQSHKGWIWCVRFSPDGSQLLSCSSDRSLKMWDVKSESVLITLGGHLHRWCWAAFSPGRADKFISCALDLCIKVWDFEAVQAGQVPPTGGLHYTILITSQDGKYVATCQGWSNKCIVTSSDGSPACNGFDHGHFVETAAFSRDCKTLISVDTGHGGEYTEGSVYNSKTMTTDVVGGTTHQLDVRGGCALAGGQNVICAGTADRTVDFFDVNEYKKQSSWTYTSEGSAIDTPEKQIITLDCSNKDHHVAVGAGKFAKILDLSDPKSPKFVTELGPHDVLIRHCKFSPDGNYLVTATISGSLQVWDATDNYSLLHNLEGHRTMIKAMEFSPDGTHFASVEVGMSLKIREVNNGFKLKAVWYGPVNQMGFVDNNVITIGEATGLKRQIQF